MRPLPIDAHLEQIQQALQAHSAVVVEAAPGAGKTTRIPPHLLDSVVPTGQTVLVCEPRRLAARLAARHVAEETGSRLGDRVGYSVRFEERSGPKTRLRYVTEGLLLRWIQEAAGAVAAGTSAPPNPLKDARVVVLDEFHERKLDGELCLAQLRYLQEQGAALKLLVMSATLDAGPIAEQLACPIVSSEGRAFPVTVHYDDSLSDRPIERQVSSAVGQVLKESASGNVLVFLPTVAAILRTVELLKTRLKETDVEVLPLHGSLPLAEQARAVGSSERRKVVVSTNVAESSVTVSDVTAVVDSGLVQVASTSPFSGGRRLSLLPVSQASATQRAGRAGRTQPGVAIRLYSQADFKRRPEYDVPEIERADLAPMLLSLAAQGLSLTSLNFLATPPQAALDSARDLLSELGALSSPERLNEPRVTELGRAMQALPVHPRLARVVLESHKEELLLDGCRVAALLSEPDLFRDTSRDNASGDSDILFRLEAFSEAQDEGFSPRICRQLRLDRQRARSVAQVAEQLYKLAERHLATLPQTPTEALNADSRLALCLLAGFPDRVARPQKLGERALILATGTRATLSEYSVVREAPVLLALELDERPHTSSRRGAVVSIATRIEADWLLERDSPRLSLSDSYEWNDGAERVEQISRIAWGSVVLDETRSRALPCDEASEVLARMAWNKRKKVLGKTETELEQIAARLALLETQGLLEPSEQLESSDGPTPKVALLLENACQGMTSFDELRSVDWTAQALTGLPANTRDALARYTPSHLTLPGGRRVAIHYEMDKEPWVASRLQDFFGMKDGPTTCNGRLPLTLHLLAPNQRAVQITSDLEGFWERHYPTIRKELMRRYPRHPWPEDGRNAEPPKPRPPRRRQ